MYADSDVIRQVLRRFVSDNFVKEKTSQVPGDDDSFLENGIIDSTGVVELVSFIEETFGFLVEDEEIVPENLDSMSRLVAFVELKLA